MRIAARGLPALARRLATPRLVATLALLALSATFFCALAGYVLLRQADERQAAERRAALVGGIEELRRAGADLATLDPQAIRNLERIAGLEDVRFETEPLARGRDIQSVLDQNGRIIGWLSWKPDRSIGDAFGQLVPLLLVTGVCLIGFAGVSVWQVRRSVADLARSEQRAWTLAHEDMLTGLPNHRKMVELVDERLADRVQDEVVTLALLDLEGLKDINDAHGHRAGDALLAGLARRLNEVLPITAASGRMDGDEFAILLSAPDAAAAERMIEAAAEQLGRPFWIDAQVMQIGVTTGFAHAPHDAQSRDELFRRADLALRSAKRKARGSVLRFSATMDVEFEDRRFLERELKRALADQMLDVHYQPIVSADGARIVGAEALLRWDHPERGALAPADFVAAAERSGLMGQLGEFVLRRAVADSARWPGVYVAVNLSPVQVRDARLVDIVADVLAEHEVPASRLVLEITEGVLIDNPQEAELRLRALQALGIRLALDDFGTGYSSLTYLQRFRFDKLKIDRGFVEPLGRVPDSEALVQAIVALGRALKLGLLAEGVETEEQRVLLRLAGCEEMQGFLFARPGPREAFDRLLARTSTAARPALRAAVA